MVKIIYGSNRSDKTARLYKSIADDLIRGERVYLIVPEQTVLEAERALCEAKTPMLKCQVVSFRRLCNLIFRQYGGISYNYISKAGKQAVMWRTVKELAPMLSKYSEGADKESPLLAMLVSVMEELQMNSISADTLMEASEKLPSDDPLAESLSSLSQIYALYTHILKEKYDDPTDDITGACKRLSENCFFQNSRIYVDGFSGFTVQEADFLEYAMKQSGGITFTLGYSRMDSREQFERLRKTEKSIRRRAAKCGIPVAEEHFDEPMRSHELNFVTSKLWSFDNQKYIKESPEDIRIIRCLNRQAECAAVANDIKNRVLNGEEYKSFTVVMRDPSSYSGLISSEFEKRDIPFFMSKRTDVKAKSQTRLILSALAIKVYNWRCDSMLSYLKSGLCLLDDEETDMLCQYVQMWNISGKRWTSEDEWRMNPDGFGAEYTNRVYEKLAALNRLRSRVVAPLTQLFDSFGNDSTVLDISKALFEYLERIQLAERIAQSAGKKREQGRDAEAQEDLRLWNSIIKTLEDLVAVCSDMRITPEEYMKLLSLMLDNTDIGKIPSGSDEVTVAGAELFRKSRQKYVYVIGLNEGVFPSAGQRSGILKEKDRERLEELGITLLQSKEDMLCDEMLHFYNLISSAAEGVYLLYNDSSRPSMCISGVEMLYEKPVRLDYSQMAEKDKITSAMTAYEYAAGDKDSPLSRKIISYLGENDARYTLISGMLDTPLIVNECSIGSQITDRVCGKGVRLSQSKIDQYSDCPFAYFCKYVLHLKAPVSSEPESRDVGNYVHRVLECFFKEVAGRDLTTLTEEEIDGITDRIIEEYQNQLMQGEEPDKRTACLFARLARLSKLMVRNLIAEFSVSKFRPVLFEQHMTVDTSVPSLLSVLDDGTEVSMNGYIDRADAYTVGDDVYVRVVDYKTGSKSFSLSDIEKGLNLQMLIYLFALCLTEDKELRDKLGVKEGGRVLPAGVLYHLAGAPSVKMDAMPQSPEEAMHKIMKGIKRSGLLINDIDILSAMESDLAGNFLPLKQNQNGSLNKDAPVVSAEEFDNIRETVARKIKEVASAIRQGTADARPYVDKSRNACKYCDMKSICRKSITEKEDGNEED